LRANDHADCRYDDFARRLGNVGCVHERIILYWLQQLHHVACQAFGFGGGRKPLLHDTNPINQKFCKVPLYAVAQQPALLLLKPDIEWVGVLAVDLDLGKQRERNAVGAVAECGDLRV
jgi:hypothetical protein